MRAWCGTPCRRTRRTNEKRAEGACAHSCVCHGDKDNGTLPLAAAAIPGLLAALVFFRPALRSRAIPTSTRAPTCRPDGGRRLCVRVCASLSRCPTHLSCTTARSRAACLFRGVCNATLLQHACNPNCAGLRLVLILSFPARHVLHGRRGSWCVSTTFSCRSRSHLHR